MIQATDLVKNFLSVLISSEVLPGAIVKSELKHALSHRLQRLGQGTDAD